MGQGHTFVEEKRKRGVWAQVSVSKDVPCGVSLETGDICAVTKLTMSTPNFMAHLRLILVPALLSGIILFTHPSRTAERLP